MLFFELERLLRVSKLAAFVFENVEGLLCKHPEMERVLRSMGAAGYSVTYRVLESSNFSAPQRRRRVFFVGFRGSAPTGLALPSGRWSGKVVKDIMESRAAEYYMADEDVFRSTSLCLPPDWKQRSPEIKAIGRHAPRLHGGWGRVLSPYGLSPTLISAMGPSGQPLYLMDDEVSLRRLTPRECARLQAFPDSFKLPDDDRRAYRFLGDSVTVTVVESIGRAMERWLS